MSEWIRIEDRLPENEQDCWVVDKGRNVFDALFKISCPSYLDRTIEPGYYPGFCLNEETGYYIPISQISHWMPYYTPLPPEEI